MPDLRPKVNPMLKTDSGIVFPAHENPLGVILEAPTFTGPQKCDGQTDRPTDRQTDARTDKALL